MKTLSTCGVFLWLLAAFAQAIPQTVGTGFFGVAGVQFEQFATDPETWEAGAQIKGHWEKRGDALALADSATVFGLVADEVTAERKGDQIQTIRVVFRPKEKRGGKPADLLGQVTANVRAFTGDMGTSGSSAGTVFKYKAVTITLRADAGRGAILEFTRA